MENLSHSRRKLLLYLGLGVAGARATTALGWLGRGTGPDVSSALAVNSQRLPEFQGISQWLNSAPLTVRDLKGSVVLVEFWTLGCINCQRTLPYVVKWHQQYAHKGLKVIGIHTPEFAFERDVNNIKRALRKYNITYPVAIDNDFQTWQAYGNEYWPHLYLADRQGLLHYDLYRQGSQKFRHALKELAK